MFGYFYYGRIRKAVATFGTLFNNIYVLRKQGDKVLGQTKVPLSYGPKRKFIDRLKSMDDGEEAERQLAIKLPRMSFEIVNIQYDERRQLPKTTYRKIDKGKPGKRDRVFTGTPYLLQIQMTIISKSQDELLQILEQILPYFTPQYNVAVENITGLVAEDVPLTLQSVILADDYEGSMDSRRLLTCILDFEMQVYFYSDDSNDRSIIEQVDVNLWFDGDSDELLETVRVEGDSANNITTTIFGFLDSS